MIESISEYILGICIGCIAYFIYAVFNLISKVRKLNMDVDKLRLENMKLNHDIETIINYTNFNREYIECIANKISKLNNNNIK